MNDEYERTSTLMYLGTGTMHLHACSYKYGWKDLKYR